MYLTKNRLLHGVFKYFGLLAIALVSWNTHLKGQNLLGTITTGTNESEILQIQYDSATQQLLVLQIEVIGNMDQASLKCFDKDLQELWQQTICTSSKINSSSITQQESYFLRITHGHAELFQQYATTTGVTVTKYSLSLDNSRILDSLQLFTVEDCNYVHYVSTDTRKDLVLIPVRRSTYGRDNNYDEPASHLPENKLHCYIYNDQQQPIVANTFALRQTGTVYNFSTNSLGELHFSLFDEGGEHYVYKMYLQSNSKAIVRYDQLNNNSYSGNKAFFDQLIFNEDCVIQSGIDQPDITQSDWDIYLNKKYFEDTELLSWRIKLPEQVINQLEQAADARQQPKSEALRFFEFVKMIPRQEGGHYLVTERFKPPDTYNNEVNGAADALLVSSLSEYGQLEWSRVIDRSYAWLPGKKPIPFITEQKAKLWFFYMDKKSRKEGGETIYASSIDAQGQVNNNPIDLAGLKLKSSTFLDYQKSFLINETLVALWVSEAKQHHIYIIKL